MAPSIPSARIQQRFPCRDRVSASLVLPHHSPILPRSSHSLPLFLIRASVPGLQTLCVLHVHSSKYSAIPALRHSHKTNLKRSIMFVPLHMALCGTWVALGLHNHLPCINKPEGSKPMGALGVGKEKDFRVVAQSSGRLLDLE